MASAAYINLLFHKASDLRIKSFACNNKYRRGVFQKSSFSITLFNICLINIHPFFLTLAFTSFETNNKYKVQNSLGQQVYFAAEGNVKNIFSMTKTVVSADSQISPGYKDELCTNQETLFPLKTSW